MIPVLGILHYKNRIITENCLRTLPLDLVRSLVIVDNSERGTAPDIIPDSRIIRLYGNMGVAHGWNLTIKATPRAEWWAMLNSDVEVIRSDMERLIEAMLDNDLVYMGGFEAFALNKKCIRKVGWFDENYHPAYCEDNDYRHRATVAGMRTKWLEPVHKHLGSWTIRQDPDLHERNAVTYQKNVEYHLARWGGAMGHEVYRTPFDKEPGPAAVRLDIDRLADQQWSSERE